MNRSSLKSLTLCTVLALSLGLAARLKSQQAPTQAKSPEVVLAETKAANAALLEKQQATLEKLVELKKEAEQLRIFAKRS